MNNDARQWLSNFVHNPFLKQQQVLIIEGPQGSDKTACANIILKMARFAHPTINHVTLGHSDFGKRFGNSDISLLEHKHLAIIEEPNTDTIDRLKSLIALQTFERQRKGMENDVVTIQTNFIITTLDASRMNSEGSRRFIIVNPITAFALLSSI